MNVNCGKSGDGMTQGFDADEEVLEWVSAAMAIGAVWGVAG